jgi:peroxiredoxin
VPNAALYQTQAQGSMMQDRDETSDRPPRQWPAIALALVLIVAALAVARPWEGEPESAFGIIEQVAPDDSSTVSLATNPVVGELAPNFLLPALDGQTIELADLRGQPVFINFWATWCIFCVMEMPAMQRLADKYEGQIWIVGINVGESFGDAQSFASANEIRYPLVLDSSMDVTEAYQVRAMPTSLFVDADGVVRFVRYGVMTPPEMEEVIQPLLT